MIASDTSVLIPFLSGLRVELIGDNNGVGLWLVLIPFLSGLRVERIAQFIGHSGQVLIPFLSGLRVEPNV